MTDLNALGYGSFFAEQMRKFDPSFTPARVVGQHRREWDVLSHKGTARAVLAGKLWDPERSEDSSDTQPTVGDWVVLQESADSAQPVIVHLLERRTWLSRNSATTRNSAKNGLKRQTLVANIDYVAVVASLCPPDSQDAVARRSLSPRRIERYLTAIESGGAKPIIVINKSDLSPDPGAAADSLKKRLSGCPVVLVSCKADDGLSSLGKEMQPGQTWGFVGLSGVGKSSIVNRIIGREAQKVGAARGSDARGRHTTTHRELFQTPEGILLIDTPGMREFALAGSGEADLDSFTDITELAERCQFGDCRHLSEPGCAVRKAVASGLVPKDRLLSFQTLSQELRTQEKVQSVKRNPKKRAKKHKRTHRGFDDPDQG